MAAADLLTLDNFESKIPRWHVEGLCHLYAVVDMGSNGIRFSISDLQPSQARLLKCIYRERAPISLFDALNSSQDSQGADQPLKFPLETITQVSRVLSRFYSIAVDDFDVPPTHVTVFATEAMRRAANASSMLDAIVDAVPGLTVHILTPEVETLFGAVGARSSFAQVKGLFLDLGGGSVQMSYIDTSLQSYEIAAAKTGQSLPFGAARFIRLLEGGDPSVKAAAEDELTFGLARAFTTLKMAFPSLKSILDADASVDVYLCGGGFRGYGSMLMHNDAVQPYPVPIIGQYRVSADLFRDTQRMRNVNESYEGKVHGMSKRRRQQFPAIAGVIEALLSAVPNIGRVTFCGGGNREGQLMMMLPRHIRDLPDGSDLLSLLASPTPEGRTIWQPVQTCLASALPFEASSFSSPKTVFSSPGLGLLFTQEIWTRLGEDADANAAHALNYFTHRDPGAPGMAHLDRALLALTACARWGASLGPADKQRYLNLRRLARAADPEAPLWADYIGACAAALAAVVPIWPRRSGRAAHEADKIGKNCISFSASRSEKTVVLRITLSASRLRGLEVKDLTSLFDKVGKKSEENAKRDGKVVITVHETA